MCTVCMCWRVKLFSETSHEGNSVQAMLNYIGKFELVSMQCLRVMGLWCNELVYGCHPVWFKSKTKRQKRLKFVLRKSDFQSFEVLRYAYSKNSQSEFIHLSLFINDIPMKNSPSMPPKKVKKLEVSKIFTWSRFLKTAIVFSLA